MEGQRSDRTSEAWKAFGSDTEAGRLLKKLYCGTNKPKVLYPKPKQKKTREITVPFIPGGAVAGASDSRTHQLAANTSSRAIKTPITTAAPTMHPIDRLTTHKKPLYKIEKEVSEIKRQIEAPRMSCLRRAPNQEKEKLQQAFSYAAGSILPRDLMPGSDQLDRELAHAAGLRNGRSPKDYLTQLEEIYDAVLQEVDSRKSFISEMIALGKYKETALVEREILDRTTELRKIHALINKEKQLSSNNDGH
ncbi:uncharacterized protein PHALS_03038 [Plasmopara halstedii]|uniref:Uncharacterized protein n=1 Tax=Plasmopara halstedii TaxID=4781 RepID=A0A0P1A8E3_PLAHL|nr:uncharacterized protein PHALS_03038 [Plasmopara halstedii]CEG36490.1 hypothetical protein PHALS_03038 [Plasmopara halstedii]|eukprot:XP_024572859.1 hypothetical protein PHALS_03038 [Plasmopara halstedii]